MAQDFKQDFSDPIHSDQSARSSNRRKSRGRKSSAPSFTLPSLKLPRLSLSSFQRQSAAGDSAGDAPEPARKRKFKKPVMPSPGWFPIAGALAGFVFIIVLVSGVGRDVDAGVSIPQEEWLQPKLEIAEATNAIQSTLVKSGDNAIAALGRIGIGATASHQIVAAANPVHKLRDIRIGHRFLRTEGDQGIDIYYNIDATQRLHVHQDSGSDAWQAEMEERSIQNRQRIAHGVIKGSLFGAADAAGMDQRTTMNLVDIFAWDIDFARDMREGDTFTVLYNERFDDEGNMLESSILAAEFINQGDKFQGVRYEQADGKVAYYTPEGVSMHKAYLKAPLKFSRISSRFTLKRKHPVLGYTRAHRGIDYAASSGTPIHAIGDGYIAFKGWKNGYGNFILIKHNNRNHSTAYGHMSRFAKGISRGKRVRQGQTIGYVGMTGLATGPHLHFEFRVRNRAVNPLSIKRPPAEPIAKSERQRFLEQTAPFISRLQQKPEQMNWG